jgi:hypothetical protein
MHEIGQRAQGLVDICRRVGAVHRVQVDVVRAQLPLA